MATAAAAPVKYYTYKADVPLGAQAAPGAKSTLAFQSGKGYYAKPGAAPNPYSPPVRPAPPPAEPAPMAPTPPAQIDQQATDQAQAALTPQQDEIRRQQAIAASQATADESKITGLQTASADLMAKLGPEAQSAFETAANTEGTLGQGLATGVANDVASRVAADKSFMESQGQGGGPGPNTTALHDTLYDLNGRIPGDTLAEQGANAAKWGLAQAPIALNAGREELAARMATAKTQNDQYAQQLITLAAQFPAEKQKALAQLNQYELDKANYRLNAAHTARSDALAARSEKAQEKAAGLSAAAKTDYNNYRWATLEFQSAKAKAAAQLAVSKGHTIDVGASKLLGHIVFKDGSQDPTIKVSQSGSAASTAKYKATSHARTTAYNYAVKLLGNPVKAPSGSRGAYVAAPGANPSALFPPAYPGGPSTTNNPKYVSRAGAAGGYADAVQKVWAEIDGDGLISQWGYSKEQVMTIIKQALARAGWKRK